MLSRTLKHGMRGKDVWACKRGIARILGGGRLRTLRDNLPVVRCYFGKPMLADVKAIQKLEGWAQTGVIGRATFDVLYDNFDDTAARLYKEYAASVRPKVPQLGPIVAGGQSILLHDLTHATAGVPGFPAFDDGFGDGGRAVVAPEDCHVYRQSGSQGGDAFYIRGQSLIEYWVGHIAAAPATGTWFGKGERMARIAWIASGDGGPHVHVGINATPLIGRELEHRTDYAHGAPTVGAQLARALT